MEQIPKINESLLTDREFQLFKEKIYEESGIHFSAINRPILETRLKEKLKQLGLSAPMNYWDLINRNKDELNALLDSVTTNLTKFFRNDSHFAALRQSVFPEILLRKTQNQNKKIKIWSAGCSTGEEAYSVLITLLEILRDFRDWKIVIIASDISLTSLMVAKKGIYSSERVENIDLPLKAKYFDKVDDNHYKVKPILQELIRFDYHNLKFDNGERDFDIILCRNVIIYFDKKAQEELIKKFFVCLNEEGYLFIGHSESLFGMNSGFKFHKIDEACIYRKK